MGRQEGDSRKISLMVSMMGHGMKHLSGQNLVQASLSWMCVHVCVRVHASVCLFFRCRVGSSLKWNESKFSLQVTTMVDFGMNFNHVLLPAWRRTYWTVESNTIQPPGFTPCTYYIYIYICTSDGCVVSLNPFLRVICIFECHISKMNMSVHFIYSKYTFCDCAVAHFWEPKSHPSPPLNYFVLRRLWSLRLHSATLCLLKGRRYPTNCRLRVKKGYSVNLLRWNQ